MTPCEPHSLSSEQVAEIVRADLAACETGGRGANPTIGVPWPNSKVGESLDALKACLVTPYLQRFCLKDTAAQMRAAPPVIAVYWVIARSQHVLEFYDSDKREYGLAMQSNDGTLPGTIGVRGDLVGVFGAI